MTVLDVRPEGGVDVLRGPDQSREMIERLGEAYSSRDAQPVEPPGDHSAELAAAVGASDRAIREAQGVIHRHVGPRGRGQTGLLHLTLRGPRPIRVSGPGLMVAADGGSVCVGVALVADPLVVVVASGHGTRGLHWSLMPAGPSVTARADGLRLLRALAAGGEVVLQMGQLEEMPPLRLDGGSWEYEQEWRLFEDLAVLEEWSGVVLPMPGSVSAEDATRAAQAASWARTRQVPARLSGPIAVEAVTKLEAIDELRVLQGFGLELLETPVPLGEGVARIRVERLERDGASHRAWPTDGEVTFWLSPPPGRRMPPRRTQPEAVGPPPAGEPAPVPSPVARAATRDLAGALSERGHRRQASRPTEQILDELRGP